MDSSLDLQVPEIPVFHPVWQRNPAAWFPGDEAASLLVAGEHIWDDIVRLDKIRSQRRGEYDRKLLLKYICIELRSLTEVMDKLQAKVMSADTYESEHTEIFHTRASQLKVLRDGIWLCFFGTS